MWERVFERIGMMTAATKKAYSRDSSRIENYHMKAEVWRMVSVSREEVE